MRVNLTLGAYQARSLIANAQRCVNLYPETNSQDAPAPVTHLPTPGLTLLQTAATTIWRALYRASNGKGYGVCGKNVYYIAPDFSLTLLGTIQNQTSLCYFVDNGIDILLVDGTATKHVINLTTDVLTSTTQAEYYGATRVDFLDTFFVLNRPGTNQFYWSLSNSTDFDALDIATKATYPDPLQSIVVMHREIWLPGELKSEVWYNSGQTDSVFQRLPGAYVEHGTVAKYSIAAADLSIFCLSQDLQGSRMVLRMADYTAQRISTHAIENEINKYEVIDDAIGFTYQQEGHVFYVLTFPTADKTWVFDDNTKEWHERVWIDDSGNEHRHRANCCAFLYGKNVVGDFENGKLYELDLNAFTDDGQPIIRRRGFPHMVQDGQRVIYKTFIADMQVGDSPGTLIGDPVDVSLRWSDTRGASWGNPVLISNGSAGQYLTSMQKQRLGMARDRVFEVFWSFPYMTAIQGAFVDVIVCKT